MVLVLKHVSFKGPGLIAEMMEGRGLEYRTIEVFQEGVPLSAAGFTGIVSLGGEMSVLDGLEVINREKRLLTEALDRGLPVLGICLGAQILASACGGRVYTTGPPETGWGQVSLTGEGLTDPLFAGIEKTLPVLHWHGETFDIPPEAVHLASSDQCAHQAFRVGTKAYGFQFHLEADGEMVREWVAQDQKSEKPLLGSSEKLIGSLDDRLGPIRFAGALVFGRFLDLVAGKGSG